MASHTDERAGDARMRQMWTVGIVVVRGDVSISEEVQAVSVE